MKKIIISLLFQMYLFTEGFAKNAPWKENKSEAPISARADLDVRWEDTSSLPRKVWFYELLPNHFTPEIISNLMVLCSFREKDEIEKNSNGITFQSSNGLRKLSVSFLSGEIHYQTPELPWSTNLAIDVPKESQLPELTKNVLSKLDIPISNITGWVDHHKMDFDEVGGVALVNGKFVTNIICREVYFRKTVDNMPIAGKFYRFTVGEHGKISKLSITWPNMKRIKSYPALSKKTIISLLRKGEAMRGPVPSNIPIIDWPRVKGVVITKAEPSYLIDQTRLYPFMRLNATIDIGTGDQNVPVVIDCPIIDESKI